MGFKALVDSAIELMDNNSKRNERFRETMHPQQWLYEFRTVRLDVGRGVGKTQYILDHVLQPGELVIVPSLRFARVCGYDKAGVKTVHCDDYGLGRQAHSFRDIKRIYIDELRSCEQQGRFTLRDIIDIVSRSPEQMIIAFA